MKFKLSYYDRKIEKLQNELDNTKTELEILKSNQNNTVRLDDKQLQEVLYNINYDSEEIIDEIRRCNSTNQNSDNRKDAFSAAIRIGLAFLFIIFAVVLGYNTVTQWSTLWGQGTNYRISLAFMCVIVFDCIVLGFDIFKEKDRNYIISLFSALVALVALIVTLLK